MIYTFYSYKGGVGRSMALANVAELFYQDGLKVLMVDWDLEAPGLESFLPVDLDEVLDKPGVMDMLLGYKKQMARELPISEDETGSLPFERPDQFIVDVYPNASDERRLWLLPAGRRFKEHFAEYAHAVRTFDWQDFYQNWEGELYFEWLRQQFEQIADVVLIDSRTGVTEMGGVCTYQLADTVMMFCTPNQQSLVGTYRMAQNFKDPDVQNLRLGRPLNVLIIPGRIERAESDSLDKFQKEFIDFFKDFVPRIEGLDIQQLWGLGIPYIPKYAYKEAVAVREIGRASAEDMAAAFRDLRDAMEHLMRHSRVSQLVDTQPSLAAYELALAFSRLDYRKDRTELARIASLVEAFADPLAKFEPLLVYARSMASLARDDLRSTSDQLRRAFGGESQVQVAGVNLPIPEWIFTETRAATYLSTSQPQPFIFGGPVPLERFIGREREVKAILDLLAGARGSMAISGEALIGKTSLLHYISSPEVVEKWGLLSEKCMFIFVDSQTIAPFSPMEFWRYVLKSLAVRRALDVRYIEDLLKGDDLGSFEVGELFDRIARDGKLVVLLLDEFERIIEHVNPDNPQFLYLLRALINRPAHGLALVLASRKPLPVLCRDVRFVGSPFPTSFTSLSLGPFSSEEANELIDVYTRGTGVAFSDRDREFAYEISRGHPYWLQKVCSKLFQRHVEKMRQRVSENE